MKKEDIFVAHYFLKKHCYFGVDIEEAKTATISNTPCFLLFSSPLIKCNSAYLHQHTKYVKTKKPMGLLFYNDLAGKQKLIRVQ